MCAARRRKSDVDNLSAFNRQTASLVGHSLHREESRQIFFIERLGEVIIARLSEAGYQELSRAHLIDPDQDIGGRQVVWSHPAFANKSIFFRNDNEIRCYSLATDMP